MTVVFFDGMTAKCKAVEMGFDYETKRPTIIIDGCKVFDLVTILRIIDEQEASAK